MTISYTFLVATALCAALTAGLFYSYSCSVIPALKPLPDVQYISTMQSINKEIQNPLFFMSFIGILILLPVSTFINYSQPATTRFWLLLVATIIYFTGSFCVTAFGNIPLNNALARFDLVNASADAIRSQRASFELRWNNLHTMRTIASIISLVLVIIACISPAKD